MIEYEWLVIHDKKTHKFKTWSEARELFLSLEGPKTIFSKKVRTKSDKRMALKDKMEEMRELSNLKIDSLNCRRIDNA